MDISTINQLHVLEKKIAEGNEAMSKRNRLLLDLHRTGEYSYGKLHTMLNRTRTEIGAKPLTFDAIPKAIGRAKKAES